MTAVQIRTFLLGTGLLVVAFALISAFTPRGFSWAMAILGLLLATPWLIRERHDRRQQTRPPGAGAIPSWHPEADS